MCDHGFIGACAECDGSGQIPEQESDPEVLERSQAVPRPQPECPRCLEGDYTRRRRPDGLCHKATDPLPTMDTLMEWSFDGVAEATDGCRVEPDGVCPHGHLSWLRQLGLM